MEISNVLLIQDTVSDIGLMLAPLLRLIAQKKDRNEKSR